MWPCRVIILWSSVIPLFGDTAVWTFASDTKNGLIQGLCERGKVKPGLQLGSCKLQVASYEATPAATDTSSHMTNFAAASQHSTPAEDRLPPLPDVDNIPCLAIKAPCHVTQQDVQQVGCLIEHSQGTLSMQAAIRA